MYLAITEEMYNSDEGLRASPANWNRDTEATCPEFAAERYAEYDLGYTGKDPVMVLVIDSRDISSIMRFKVWAKLTIEYLAEPCNERK